MPIPPGAYRRETSPHPILSPTPLRGDKDPAAKIKATGIRALTQIELRTPIPYPPTDPRFSRMGTPLDIHPRGWRRLAEWHPPYARHFISKGRRRFEEQTLDEEL
jgi:hypothetical protein